MQEAQVDAESGHLPVDFRPVGLFEDRFAHVPVRVEEGVRLVVGHALDVGLGDSPLLRHSEHLADRVHRHAARARDLPPRHTLFAKLHYQLRPYPPRHDLLLLSSRRHGDFRLRGDTGSRNGRYGCGETEVCLSDTETAKGALLRACNIHLTANGKIT